MKLFSLKLPLTYSNLVKYIFVKKDETFLPTWFPVRTLSEYSYFHGNIVICLSPLTICSPCNRTQLEALHTLITKALSAYCPSLPSDPCQTHTSKQSRGIKVIMWEFQEQIQNCLIVEALVCAILGMYCDLWLCPEC